MKKLNPKQMLQRLPIAFAQVKAGNTSKNLLMKSGKSYTFFIEQNKFLKKVHKNIMNSKTRIIE